MIANVHGEGMEYVKLDQNEVPQDNNSDDEVTIAQVAPMLEMESVLKTMPVPRESHHVWIKLVPAQTERSNPQLRALGYVLLSGFLFSVSSLCAKYATKVISSQEVVFWRTAVTFVINGVMMIMSRVKPSLPRKHFWWFCLRCVTGYLVTSLQFYAFSKMVLTEATVLVFTSPMFTYMLGAILLNEPFDRADFICSLVAYVGVVFVARPPYFFPQIEPSVIQADRVLAVSSALAAAILQAVTFICGRKLRELNHFAVIHYYIMFCLVASVFWLAFTGQRLVLHSELNVALAIFGVGFFACIGLVFSTIGLQRGNAGIGSIMRYCDVVFVFILDVTILGEHINWFSIFGGCIIGASAIVVAVRRVVNTKV